MLENLLTEDDCKKLQVMLSFEKDELLDAPTFTMKKKDI